jgi:hypothetical protein
MSSLRRFVQDCLQVQDSWQCRNRPCSAGSRFAPSPDVRRARHSLAVGEQPSRGRAPADDREAKRPQSCAALNLAAWTAEAPSKHDEILQATMTIEATQ